jgi:hypothetical protein
MVNFNKTLHPDDYNDPSMEKYINLFNYLQNRIPASIQHKHRLWEHCMAMAAIDEFVFIEGRPVDILEVGSGGSLFAPMCIGEHHDIVVVDPEDSVNIAKYQNTNIIIFQEDFMEYVPLVNYDAVICLSVLEHIENYLGFFKKLLQDANHLVFLTIDFSMTGETFSKDHLRTYSPINLFDLSSIAYDYGFHLPANPAWIDNGPHVYDYNFASLCLVNNEKVQSKSLQHLPRQYQLSGEVFQPDRVPIAAL